MRTKTLQRENKENMAKVRQQPSAPMPRPVGMAASLLSLQRSHGNWFVQRLLRSGAIQAKLSISQPGDEYEREADQVADQVMRMAEPEVSAQDLEQSENRAPEIQRKCAACEEEEQVQRETGGETLPGEASTEAAAEMSLEVESGIARLRGRGQPLPQSARDFFEPRFGYDLGEVRVHTGAQAGELARAVSARAFTFGRDIVLAPGEDATETPAGRRLLAHELVHVVQQTPEAMMRKAAPQTHGPILAAARANGGLVHRPSACSLDRVAREDTVPSRRSAAPISRSPSPTIHRVCKGKEEEITGNAILSDKEQDYRQAVRAGKYCKDTGATGVFHKGRCYREIPPSRIRFPPGDQVCFDEATGQCAEDSPDVCAAVESQNADGSCNLGFERSICHFAGDIFPSEPGIVGASFGLLSGAALGYASHLGGSRSLGAGTGAVLGAGIGTAIGAGSRPLASWLKRRGYEPVVGTELGVAIPIPNLLASTLQARLYIGAAKRDRAYLSISYPEFNFGVRFISEATTGGSDAFPVESSTLTSLLAGIRIDPGQPGGGFFSFHGGPALAIGRGDKGIGAEAGIAFGQRWRFAGVSANVGYISDPTREHGGGQWILGASVEVGPDRPKP